GQIQQSNAVVMHVKVLSGQLPPDPKWRGVVLSRFDGQRWWNPVWLSAARTALRAGPRQAFNVAQAAPDAFYSPTTTVHQAVTLRYLVVMEPVGLNVFFLAPVPMQLQRSNAVAVEVDGSVFTIDG